MGHLANDSASNNATAAAQIERRLVRRGVGENWHAKERNLSYIFSATSAIYRILLTNFDYRCFSHVVSLGIEDFMDGVTQVAVVESKQAIWEYDPRATESLVLGGLDTIATIRTLATKVCG